eukprot:6780312-Alexandrium_andersonii.AAC.1
MRGRCANVGRSVSGARVWWEAACARARGRGHAKFRLSNSWRVLPSPDRQVVLFPEATWFNCPST